MPICEKCGYGGALYISPGSNKVTCPKCFHEGERVPVVCVPCPTCHQIVGYVASEPDSVLCGDGDLRVVKRLLTEASSTLARLRCEANELEYMIRNAQETVEVALTPVKEEAKT